MRGMVTWNGFICRSLSNSLKTCVKRPNWNTARADSAVMITTTAFCRRYWLLQQDQNCFCVHEFLEIHFHTGLLGVLEIRISA